MICCTIPVCRFVKAPPDKEVQPRQRLSLTVSAAFLFSRGLQHQQPQTPQGAGGHSAQPPPQRTGPPAGLLLQTAMPFQIAVSGLLRLPDHLIRRNALPLDRLLPHQKDGLLKQLRVR